VARPSAYSRRPRRGPNDPWFRIGTLDIGSAAFLGVLCVASVFMYAIDKSKLVKLALIPSEVRSGEVWRVASWPLANGFDQQLLWVVISIAVLWYFGARLEDQIGRVRMAWYLAMIIVIPGVIGAVFSLPQAGIHTIELIVLLTFVAEYPNVRFFFGIPAWVIGVVLAGVEVLQLLGDRVERLLLFFIVSVVVGALAGRSVGLLDAYQWIPKVGVPRRSRKQRRDRRRAAVVSGPWGGSTIPASDHTELDALLDKISATGMDSLTRAEKNRLNELSKRLRGN
jgi:hypothetical protein